jgi:hypothetical protein
MKALLTLLAVALAGCGGGGSIAPTTVTPCTITMTGDSIIAKNTLVGFSDYIRARRPNFIITDLAVGGMKLREITKEFHTQVVLIELGGNDVGDTPEPEVEALFKSTIESIKGATIVVTGIVPLTNAPNSILNQTQIDNAAILDTYIHTYTSVNRDIIDANWRQNILYKGLSDTTDGVHLNKEAAERFAEGTIKYLDMACGRTR